MENPFYKFEEWLLYKFGNTGAEVIGFLLGYFIVLITGWLLLWYFFY